jgi:phosphopantetheine--protein transferase-like protein
MIGNDIVDLRFFALPNYQHVRHLDRVCTPTEALAVRQSKSPSVSLSVIWAAKEAAYKLLSKRHSGCSFVPTRLVSDFCPDMSTIAGTRLQIRCGEVRANVSVSITDRWVHATAIAEQEIIVHWGIQEVAQRGGLEQSANQSEAVRCLARQLLSDHGCEHMQLMFAGRIPMLTGTFSRGVEMGVSLSHDGSFVAAAIGWSSSSSESSASRPLPRGRSSGEACFTCTA